MIAEVVCYESPVNGRDVWVAARTRARRQCHAFIGGCLSCWRVASTNAPYATCQHTGCGGRMTWGCVDPLPRTGLCTRCARSYYARGNERPRDRCRCGAAIVWEPPVPRPVVVKARPTEAPA